MSPHKTHGNLQQLLGTLYRQGWETEDVIEITDWWSQKVWKLRSNRQAFGLKLFITPVTDPNSTDYDSKDIWCIRASSHIPNGFYDESNVIADCYTNSRGFEKRLDELISEIETYRNTSQGQ